MRLTRADKRERAWRALRRDTSRTSFPDPAEIGRYVPGLIRARVASRKESDPGAQIGQVVRMVSFSDFHALDPETADLARELLDNAARQRSSFMSFVSLWMAFNGWIEAVTGLTNDARMIDAIADNRRLIEAFEALLDERPAFQRAVMGFAADWPVINVRDARRKLGRDAFFRFDRDEFLEECRRHEVKTQPLGWDPGEMPTWPQLLRTVYAVRCNLFHGSKSPQNRRDRDLVRHSDRVLRAFIEGSGCLGWHD